jgi:hypothetical protein
MTYILAASFVVWTIIALLVGIGVFEQVHRAADDVIAVISAFFVWAMLALLVIGERTSTRKRGDDKQHDHD